MLDACRESLTLYAKQAAWLAVTPDKWDKSRAEKWAKEDGENPRPESLLPPIDYCEELARCFFEVGPAPKGEQITHTELRNYQDNTGVELDEFEVTMLVTMSKVYLATYQEAKEPNFPWPAARELTQQEKYERSLRMKRRTKKETE